METPGSAASPPEPAVLGDSARFRAPETDRNGMRIVVDITRHGYDLADAVGEPVAKPGN